MCDDELTVALEGLSYVPHAVAGKTDLGPGDAECGEAVKAGEVGVGIEGIGGRIAPGSGESRATVRAVCARSGGARNGHQPWPRSATRCRAWLLLPPIHIGGWGSVTGRGCAVTPRALKCRPENETLSEVQIALSTSRASSNRSLRSAWSTPSAAYSPLRYPAPAARVKRPPERRSRVAPALATMNGFRYGRTTMFGISRSVVVRAAAKPIATNGSRASWPPDSSQR